MAIVRELRNADGVQYEVVMPRRAEVCFLAEFSDKPCDGRLVKAHLLPRQLLKREHVEHAITDPRSWVWACGGPMGNAGHHGMLDTSRTLRVPRDRIPRVTEDLAKELGLTWWLDREYSR